jgi:hypothetical protein
MAWCCSADLAGAATAPANSAAVTDTLHTHGSHHPHCFFRAELDTFVITHLPRQGKATGFQGKDLESVLVVRG